jgi:hypothetical protein
MNIAELRREYHRRICEEVIRIRRAKGKEYPNSADSGNRSSIQIAWGIVRRLGCPLNYEGVKEQTAGGLFEEITRDFLESAFGFLHHLRPGKWRYSTTQTAISGFVQYEHLAQLQKLEKFIKKFHLDKEFRKYPELEAAFKGDYIIKPDIVITRSPIPDAEVNLFAGIVSPENHCARLTPLREANHPQVIPILHASISCKWTIRSDRAQNTRTEALNLIRNRKGGLPHIVAVVGEPLPTRIAALAMGTGDLDCVYHFALNELRESITEIDNQDQMDMLRTMLEGRRLRDISDLPFDLAI